ncbi:hypothetical protein [Brachyspira sp.]|uniref:hypothetical protein n=1 Tax=Brachyspira sp. TaxID=1977261 RepID=UPI003D7C89F4
MENRLTKNLLTNAILFIFFIFVFIQACGPTPATAMTDTTQTPIASGKSYTSEEPILGTGVNLTISGLSALSVKVGIKTNNATTSSDVTLTNISGDSGNYTYGNNEMTLSVTVADASAITVNLTRLKAPYLLLENITCVSGNP